MKPMHKERRDFVCMASFHTVSALAHCVVTKGICDCPNTDWKNGKFAIPVFSASEQYFPFQTNQWVRNGDLREYESTHVPGLANLLPLFFAVIAICKNFVHVIILEKCCRPTLASILIVERCITGSNQEEILSLQNAAD